MNITIELKKDFYCTHREIAEIIWTNMMLAKELEFIYQTKVLGDDLIKPKELTIDYITKVVCDKRGVPYIDLFDESREDHIKTTRQIAMYWCKRKTNKTLAEIGNYVGGKDHATVIHSAKTIQNYMDTNKNFRSEMVDIENAL